MDWLIVLLSTGAFSGLAWYLASGVRIKAGWQNGESPLARYLDAKRRERFPSLPLENLKIAFPSKPACVFRLRAS